MCVCVFYTFKRIQCMVINGILHLTNIFPCGMSQVVIKIQKYTLKYQIEQTIRITWSVVSLSKSKMNNGHFLLVGCV